MPSHDSSQENELAEMDPFIVWLLRRSGIDAGAYRKKALARRLAACLRQLRVASTAQARTLLDRQPHLVPLATGALLIGVTEFFRDRLVFDRIRQQVVPPLVEGRAPIRICCAGVSDGQELYSMAMLLSEAGALERSELVGVDCRSDAIAHGRAGWFRAADLEAVPPHWVERYFETRGSGFAVKPELRGRTQWKHGDLFAMTEGGWNLILFRNVAIYLTPPAAGALWNRLHAQVVEGGFLITGKAEKPPASLRLQMIAPCIYRKLSA